MPERKNGQLPPEGDLNTAAIKKGLTPDQQDSLRRDLEAVESGDTSTESILRGGASDTPKLNFHEEWHRGNERAEREQMGVEIETENFEKFLRAKGFSETKYSYNDIYDFVEQGEVRGDPFKDSRTSEQRKAITAELQALETEWKASLK